MDYDYSDRLKASAENFLVKEFSGDVATYDAGKDEMGREMRYPRDSHSLIDAAMHIASGKVWHVEPQTVQIYAQEMEFNEEKEDERDDTDGKTGV